PNSADRRRPSGRSSPSGWRTRAASRVIRGGRAHLEDRPVGLAVAQAELLAAKAVGLHLAVERRRVDQGVLRAVADGPAVLAEHVSEVIALGAAQELLERPLVVEAPPRRPLDARTPVEARDVDLADGRSVGPEDGALQQVAELAHVAGPRVAHELLEGLVRD